MKRTGTSLPRGFDPRASFNGRGLWIAVVVLTALAVAVPAHGQCAFAASKYECDGHFSQTMTHGAVAPNITHSALFTPNVKWQSQTDFIENGTGASDSLQIVPSTVYQHLVAICPGEAAKGNPWSFSLSVNNPPVGVTRRAASGQPGPPGWHAVAPGPLHRVCDRGRYDRRTDPELRLLGRRTPRPSALPV